MSYAIVSYATYIPRHRVRPDDSGATPARVVASYDEDTTTMAVEACRRALSEGEVPGAVYFATSEPAYMDKTNATAIHAALDLGRDGFAVDVAGSPRSGIGALRAAAASGGIAVLSDVRTGRPGSLDERQGADAAVAFRFGEEDDSLAVIVSEASTTAEFLDRWRAPGERASHQWEERFGLEIYVPLAREAASRALADAGVERADHVVVSSPHGRAVKALARELGAGRSDGGAGLGYAGAADAGLRLAAALDRVGPGETILLVAAADGCDATVLRATDRAGAQRQAETLEAQLAGGRSVPYMSYLTWRGLLEREPPRRPDPDPPAAPPAARAASWKFAFVGSRCGACGRVHLPPRRVCAGCGAVDRMERAALAGRRGTVAALTVDRLAFSPAPPLMDAVVDFDGGGRCALEIADATPDEIGVGTRVEPTFRRMYTAGGVHNYFWKARPVLNGQ